MTGRKPKGKGRVAEVFNMYEKQKLSVTQIAEKTGLSERVVRSYIWRARNPEKYKLIVQRYFERKRQKKENKQIREAVKNSNKTKKRKKKEAAAAE